MTTTAASGAQTTAEPTATPARQGVERYDALLIGSGQAANPLAASLAGAGWKVAVVEREHVGGTCINEGCTPSKTMVASARVAYLSRRGGDYGVRTGPVAVDVARVRQRKREIVDSFRGGSERRLERAEGVTLVRGQARFTGPKEVEVRSPDGSVLRLTAEHVFLNTGARPSWPAIPGLDGVPTLNSTTIMELDTVPEHLLVLGGGYVGLEFAQMFRRFGSRVTIVQRSGRLLGREDDDIAQAVADVLRQDGIELYLETEAVRAEPAPDGQVRLVVRTRGDGAGKERALSASHLLVATGRTPNTADLNLAATGLQTDERGFVPANERLETTVPGIYALGDVKGGPAFTHISYDDYRIVAANLLHDGQSSTAGRLVPYTVFIDPQLGRVGLTEAEAQRQGRDVKVARLPMSAVARALEMDEPRGLMKAIVDAASGEILGAAVLGIEGGEVMAMLQIAMMGHLPYTALRDAVFAHPTLAEALNNLFATLDA